MIDGQLIAVSIALKLFFAFVSMPLVFWMLRQADNRLSINFKERVDAMGDLAFAVYAGSRIVAICLLVGFALF